MLAKKFMHHNAINRDSLGENVTKKIWIRSRYTEVARNQLTLK